MGKFNDYLGIPRPRKVKHVKFIKSESLINIESEYNMFADEHPNYKILGVRLMCSWKNVYILTVTYLEDSGGITYEDRDDSYED